MAMLDILFLFVGRKWFLRFLSSLLLVWSEVNSSEKLNLGHKNFHFYPKFRTKTRHVIYLNLFKSFNLATDPPQPTYSL